MEENNNNDYRKTLEELQKRLTQMESRGPAADELSLEDIKKLMAEGAARGEQLTGATAEEIGQGRRDIRSRYADIVNQPSRGAERATQARNAEMRRSRQRQSSSRGMGGQQDQQVMANYAGKIGDVRQKEYLDSLNRLDRQYRGGGQDIMGAEGQYASIGVSGQPRPEMPKQKSGFLSDLFGDLF